MEIDSQPIPDLYHLPGFYEPSSAISHLLGAVIFLGLGLLLLRRGWGNWARVFFLGVYVFSGVLLFAMSGVYHQMVRGGTAHQVLGRIDHGAIFVLIAGTFTPAHGILFQGWLRWAPLMGIWSAAITGITLKTIFFEDLAEWLWLTFYLSLGWVGAISAVLLGMRYGFAFIKPLLWGGLVYSLGGALDLLNWPVVIPGVVHPHEVFHLAVLAGAWFHWCFVWQFATGKVEVNNRY
ncbi:MAG TPA: hemolysin III family protein [Gemmataceae bacterium]|jgi:channel protein (hemolysin III family)|nr:hemolysin III family protein [Gemmataceae bacterium]